MSSSNIPILNAFDSQVSRFLTTVAPRNACQWSLAINEIGSIYNDLLRLGLPTEDLEKFIERTMATAKLYGVPSAKLAKLESLLVIPDDYDDDDSVEDDEDTVDTEAEGEEESVLSPVVSSVSPIKGGRRRGW